MEYFHQSMYDQLIKYIKEKITISDEEIAMILPYFKSHTARKNEILITHGQTSQRSFFVRQGCIRIFFLNEKGQDATRYFAFENQWATSLVSFITGQPSMEYIQALEPTELLYIRDKDYFQLLAQVPAWERFYRFYLEKAYVISTNHLMTYITMDATDRYRLLLEKNPIVVKRLPNKMVASFLNISESTLSRLKSKI